MQETSGFLFLRHLAVRQAGKLILYLKKKKKNTNTDCSYYLQKLAISSQTAGLSPETTPHPRPAAVTSFETMWLA